MNRIPFIKALEATLRVRRQAIVSTFTLFVLAYQLDRAGHYDGIPFYHQHLPLTRGKVSQLIASLRDARILRSDPDFSMGIYRVSDVSDAAPEEICAMADPFCYLSHLSAMRRYGLTNRLPAQVSITSPARVEWRRLAVAEEARLLGHEIAREASMHLKRVSFPAKVRGMPVLRNEAKYSGHSMQPRDSFARIATIGTTFADMLDRPALCGGMAHVLDVWREHALSYLDDIIESITLHQQPVVKVRAGYILEEILHQHDPRIALWLSAAQRGGSRVLDPEHKFAPTFSEKWMLSLNV